MGRRRALARPETCQGALTACLARFLARLGARCLANAVQAFGQGGYQRAGWSEMSSVDMVGERGGAQIDQVHEGRHGTWHELSLPFSHFNQPRQYM
jgi:hypothetical protein